MDAVLGRALKRVRSLESIVDAEKTEEKDRDIGRFIGLGATGEKGVNSGVKTLVHVLADGGGGGGNGGIGKLITGPNVTCRK